MIDQTFLTLPLSIVLGWSSFTTYTCLRSQCTSSSTVIAALEGAREAKAPVIIQVSQGGAAFFAGKAVKNDAQQASIAGATAAAMFVR